MRVGVPKEIKNNECRVGLTPASVRELVAHGHQVVVETQCGIGIGMTDEDYQGAGATIAADAAEVFASAEMIVKVKEPQPVEWERMRPGQIMWTYLHLARLSCCAGSHKSNLRAPGNLIEKYADTVTEVNAVKGDVMIFPGTSTASFCF